MKSRIVIVGFAAIAALICVGSAPLQDVVTPLAPHNIVLVLTDVGSASSLEEKIEVGLVYGLQAGENQRAVQIEEKGDFNMGANIFVKDGVNDLAEALQAASDAALSRETLARTIGEIRIQTVKSGVGTHVIIRGPRPEGLSLRGRDITVDADNAALLAQLMRRAMRIDAWFEARLKHLDPS